jgi:Fic family protein
MNLNDFSDSSPGELVPILEAGVSAWAYVPHPLPAGLPLNSAAVNLLGLAENALGRLQGSVGRMLNPYLVARPLLRREAILSSRMEGTNTTAARLVSAEAGASPTADVETREVANYLEAMSHGVRLLKSLPLCTRLIRALHEKLLAGVRGADEVPGRVRRVQNFIGRADIASARFVPPPPDRLDTLLADLERYMNLEESTSQTPLLVRMAMVHYQFETIHPFRDGNGRVGRLLIPLTFLAHGRLSTPTLYLSGYLEQRKRQYVDLMLEVSQRGDFLPWIEFFLDAVRVAAEESAQRADLLLALREQYHTKLHTTRSPALTLKLVDALFELPLLTVARAAEILNVTAATAGQHLGRLEDAGIVNEITGRKRDRQFVAPDLLHALGTDEAPRLDQGTPS